MSDAPKAANWDVVPLVEKAFSLLPKPMLDDVYNQLKGTEPLKAPFSLLQPLYDELGQHRAVALTVVEFITLVPQLVDLFQKVKSP